jgi:hypothetical protein
MQTTTHQCGSAVHNITRRLTLTDRHGTFYLRISLVKYTLYHIHYFYNLTAFSAFYAVRITLNLPPDIRFDYTLNSQSAKPFLVQQSVRRRSCISVIDRNLHSRDRQT